MDTMATCDTSQQVYGVYYDPQTKLFACQAGNNECQMMDCQCDVEFANSLIFR